MSSQFLMNALSVLHSDMLAGLDDVKDVADPLAGVDMGLVSSANKPMPLKAVHIRACMLDLVAQVRF